MFIALVSLALTAPIIPEAGETERDVRALQGNWKVVYLKISGHCLLNADDPSHPNQDSGELGTVTIRGKKLLLPESQGDKKSVRTARLKFAATVPRSVEIDDNGTKQRATYWLNGNRLTLCVAERGQWATELDPDHADVTIWVFERVGRP